MREGKDDSPCPESAYGWQAVSRTTPLDFDPPTPTHTPLPPTYTHSASGTASGNMPRKRKVPSSPNLPKRATRQSGGHLVEGLTKERDPHKITEAEHKFLAVTTHRYV